MPFASGNKKNLTSTVKNIGATDNAIVMDAGAFLFSPGPAKTNEVLDAATPGPNWTIIALAAAAAVAFVGMLWLLTKK